jgi:hypothetical protein
MAITMANNADPLSLGAPPLCVSKGLPPPESDLAGVVDAGAALLLLVATVPLWLVAVVKVLDFPTAPPAALLDVDWGVVDVEVAIDVAIEVGIEVVTTVWELVFEFAFELETCDWVTAVVLAVAFVVATDWVLPVTPGLFVGIVTEVAGALLLIITGLIVVFPVPALLVAIVVVEDFCNVGHRACIIPPPITIPNNVFELTDTSEQALVTLWATASKADWHVVEHPLLKSDVVHDGMVLLTVSC